MKRLTGLNHHPAMKMQNGYTVDPNIENLGNPQIP